MAIFDNLGKKITDKTQNVARGAKEFTDVARLNSLISDEQRKIAGLYDQLGKLYYQTAESDPDTALGRICLAIDASNQRIAKHNEEINQIKGLRRCSKCGADVPLTSAFCGECGTKLESAQAQSTQEIKPTKFCAYCGAEISDKVAFCTSCGQKAEDVRSEDIKAEDVQAEDVKSEDIKAEDTGCEQ